MEKDSPQSEPVDSSPPRKKIITLVGNHLKKFCLDMLPVIAGVVIGLYLTAESEERQNRKLLDNTLEALSNEFKANGLEINKKLIRHTRIFDSLKYYQSDTQYNLNDILGKAGGLASSQIYTTNWQATLNNYNLQIINFETVKLLSRIENIHDELTKQVDIFYEKVYAPSMYARGEEGVSHRKIVMDVMEDYKANEQELLQLYNEFSVVVETKRYRQD